MQRIHKNTIWTGAIFGALTQVSDTIKYMKGNINRREYSINTFGNVVSSLGLMAGIEYGAIIGSVVFPGAGTVAGSILGGFIGDYFGRHVGHHTGNIIHKEQIVKVSGDHVSITNNYDSQTDPELVK